MKGKRFNVETGKLFKREARVLSKKYDSIAGEVLALVEALEVDPLSQGKSLGKSCYKIRLAIDSKGKGKSGGARVIICVKVLQDRVVLLSIYDKSEKENLAPGELDWMLATEGL